MGERGAEGVVVYDGLERSTASTGLFVGRQIGRRGKDLHTQSHTLLITRGCRDDGAFRLPITNPFCSRGGDPIYKAKRNNQKNSLVWYKKRIQTRGYTSLKEKDVS